MTTVLVIGGAGYVGSHCCKAFAEAGWNVVTFDNLSGGWRDFVKFGPLIEGDIRDRAALDAAIRETRPDVVAHFAGLIEVGLSVTNPGAFYDVNVTGTLNILEAMTAAGVNRMIFSSTCATYGAPVRTPMDETHPQWPINPYGWTKLFAERMMADFDRAHGLRYAALRYFNAAGADASAEIGERHEPETHVIPLAIRGAKSSDYTFTIFGDDYDTRDGTCVRDYIHVTDLADAHRRAIQHLLDGGASEAFNLGTGVGTTVAEVAAAVETASGRPLPRKFGPRRPGDSPALVAAAEKANRLLGWTPRHSSIDNIVQTAWRWHLRQP
ncbi:UDP-glucose 4-epimerase GalE [bacterium]|nr:UDP-glucose 4-epimerase GalE [bacterium]